MKASDFQHSNPRNFSLFFSLKKLAQQETTWVHEEGELSTKTHKLKKFG